MNGYSLANHFRKLRASTPFSSIEADLFYELVGLCNERNWPTEFQYSNLLLCATLGISEKSLITARNRLKQAGLLEFTSGHKRSPTVYRFLSSEPDLPLPEVSKSGSVTGSKSGSVTGSITGTSINKEKTKRKTTPLAAAGGRAVELGEVPSALGQPTPSLPPWQAWLLANAPEVLRLKTPLTAEQWNSLVADFGQPLVQEVLLAMQNHAGLTKKYTSANLTARDWCKRRCSDGRPPQPAPPPRPAPPRDTGPALNHEFLAAQAAREAEELARQNAEWQQAQACAA